MSKELKEVRESGKRYLRKSIRGRGNSKCESTEAGARLRCLGSSKGASVTFMEVVIGDEVRDNGDQIT